METDDAGAAPGRVAAWTAVVAGLAAFLLLLDPPTSPTPSGVAPAADRSLAGPGRGSAGAPEDPRPPSGPADLTGAFRRARDIGALTSLVVSRGGETLGEAYYHGGSAGEPVNIKSASKSVLSALVGIAVSEGHLEGTRQPVSELLPEEFEGLEDPRKRRITVGHLLSMQAGLRTTSFDSYGAWVSSRDWIRWALERPMECRPGRCWEYSTGNYHLLSAALTEATGVDTRSYARSRLFAPLDIPARPWDRSPRGYYLGGNNMALTARELLRFGELYLEDGRWNGRQVVPRRWIGRSWTPRVVSSWNGNDYGLGWWGRRLGGERVWFAWGYGGQYLFLVPRLDLAVVTTTAPERERGRRDTDRAIFRLLREEIVPEVRRTVSRKPAP